MDSRENWTRYSWGNIRMMQSNRFPPGFDSKDPRAAEACLMNLLQCNSKNEIMALNGHEIIFSAVLSMESLVGHMNKSPNHMKHLYFHCFHDIIECQVTPQH